MSARQTPGVRLGHVVLYVRSLSTALPFYRDLIGLQVMANLFDGRAVMLSGGHTHHELMLIEIGDAPGPLQGKRLGLYHLAWKVGEDLDALRIAHRRLQSADWPIKGMADHTISQSIYLADPDGNEVEVYVDDPTIDWRNDSSWCDAPVKPLNLD